MKQSKNQTVSVEEYEQTQAIQSLSDISGAGTELVSVYIPPDMAIQQVRSRLQQEKSMAENIKSKKTRKRVSEAISSVLTKLSYYEDMPENGLVIFSGTVEKGGKEDHDTVVFDSLPVPIESFVYHCDSSFKTDVLERLYSASDETYALLVMDRRSAQIGRLEGDTVVHLKSMSSRVPGKHTAGGQSQQRFERIRLEAIYNFYKKIAKTVNSLFEGKENDINGLLIGGPSPTKEEFIAEELLHHELQDAIIGQVDMSDTTESGLDELVEMAGNLLEETKIASDKACMDTFFSRVRDGDDVTYGLSKTYRHLFMGAVEEVLISEAIIEENEQVPICAEGHIMENGECGICSNEKVEERPVCDVLFEGAEERGSDVRIISTGFEQGVQFKQGFGGVGGLLRYSL